MVKIQLIYTMDKGQYLANFPLHDYILGTKKNFITFAKDAFYHHICFVENDKWGINAMGENLGLPEEMAQLPTFVKISCCIITQKGEYFKEPVWYKKCKGKLYWKDLNPNKPNPY